MKNEKKIPAPLDLNPNSDLPPDADVEERFNDFWKQNGTFIFSLIGIVGLVVMGIQVKDYLSQRSTENRTAAYAEATGPAAKLIFAADNSNTKLGGIAYLETADQEYADGDFIQAANHYKSALEGLADTAFVGRARLGAALALHQNNDATAVNLLDQIAHDPNLLEVTRAEASYHLAVIYWEQKSFEDVRRSLDLIEALEAAGTWQSQANYLKSQIPELATL